jgi:cell wall-associated NlpC family hydrolase
LFFGCDRPKPLLGCRTCDAPGPHRRARCKRQCEAIIKPLKRQASAFVIAVAAGSLAAGGATAGPTVSSKQAEAQQVLRQINQIDASMGRAVEAYDAASTKLGRIRHAQRVNRFALRVARGNLARAQAALAQRLVAIYTSGDDTSTLAVLLGARSIDDLVNRVETVQSVTRQNTDVIDQVTTFKAEVQRHERTLAHARVLQARVVAARAADRARIEGQLAARKSLLAGIRSEIARLQAAEQRRQAALAAQARTRFATQQPVDTSGSIVGVSASTPGATVAPPSQYGGVVGIAMQYLGTPYVWGGASPSGFDCSGFVMYVYAQVGVSLPHSSFAQWSVGVPVSSSDLQPGDLVFFDGLNHVGLYIGGGQFIHSPHTGDVVKISSLSESWYAATYVGARRITG